MPQPSDLILSHICALGGSKVFFGSALDVRNRHDIHPGLLFISLGPGTNQQQRDRIRSIASHVGVPVHLDDPTFIENRLRRISHNEQTTLRASIETPAEAPMVFVGMDVAQTEQDYYRRLNVQFLARADSKDSIPSGVRIIGVKTDGGENKLYKEISGWFKHDENVSVRQISSLIQMHDLIDKYRPGRQTSPAEAASTTAPAKNQSRYKYAKKGLEPLTAFARKRLDPNRSVSAQLEDFFDAARKAGYDTTKNSAYQALYGANKALTARSPAPAKTVSPGPRTLSEMVAGIVSAVQQFTSQMNELAKGLEAHARRKDLEIAKALEELRELQKDFSAATEENTRLRKEVQEKDRTLEAIRRAASPNRT